MGHRCRGGAKRRSRPARLEPLDLPKEMGKQRLMSSKPLRVLRFTLALFASLGLVAPSWGARPATKPVARRAVPAQVVSAERPTPWLYKGSDIPPDPNWLFGTLPNGVRYAVRRSGVPPQQVSVRVDIEAGSLNERDNERGFAHFMEHLSFRGSRYIAYGEAIKTWQRLGATFGSDPSDLQITADITGLLAAITKEGPGDLFVIRIAGNVVSGGGAVVKGSVEYAVAELKVPLVMVLGHSNCGAVKAAVQHIDDHDALPGAINDLVNLIKPAVELVRDKPGDKLTNAIRANVELGVERLKGLEPILAGPVRAGKLKVVGATYDLATGRVKMVV